MKTSNPITDYIYSLIRTAVPYVAGLLMSVPGSAELINLIGVDSATARRTATTASAFVLAFLYYLIVRALEQKWPKLGVLLGVPRRPVYGDTTS